MFVVALSLLAAAAYGTGDFFGAIGSRKSSPITVSFFGHLFYAETAGLGLLFISGTWSNTSLIVGLVTGLSEALGFLLFYYVLLSGPVAVVSPMVSVIYSMVPVVWGIIRGDQVGLTGWVGIAVGIFAVLTLSLEQPTNSPSKETNYLWFLLLALVAGIMWGLSTVSLAYAPKDSGIVSIVVAGCTAFLTLTIVSLISNTKVNEVFKSKSFGSSASSGVLFGIANILIVISLRLGSLPLVGMLTSMYPLATVFLARLILKERITRVQWFGIVLAITAAALLSYST